MLYICLFACFHEKFFSYQAFMLKSNNLFFNIYIYIQIILGKMLSSLLLASSFAAVCLADDPADSWLSYAVFQADANAKITQLNTTWTVPSNPASSFGSNAPGWWFGVQTADGAGALIQPILAYGYQGNVYSIFNGVFDWNDESWHTSPEVYTVQPGDKITSSVVYHAEDNSYDMIIASGSQSITTNYQILAAQGEKTESVGYFVLEHQPLFCSAYPTDGECTFENITVEVDNKPVVSPVWKAQQQNPKCNSAATVVDASTIRFTWDAKQTETANEAQDDYVLSDHTLMALNKASKAPKKWGYGL